MSEKTVSSRLLFEGKMVRLRLDAVKMPDGREATREILERPDCIAVVPVDADDNILLVRQYRKAVEKEMLEIPAGGIDPGEDPETAVCREMREETGYAPGKIERMGGFYAAPGYCTEYLYVFLATDLVPSPLIAEDTDGIEVVRVPASQVKELVTSGTICDAKSVAGLLLYMERRKAGQV